MSQPVHYGRPPVPPGTQAWPERVLAHPHSEPRPYPLMLRTWTYAWWQPLAGIVVLLVSFFFLPLLAVPVLVVALLVEGGTQDLGTRLAEASTLQSITPASLLFLNLALAALTLVSMGLVRYVHRLRPRWLSSVLPGMRWGFFFACFGLSFVALFAAVGVGLLLPTDTASVASEPNEITSRLLASAIVILLTTPLQALGEEYAFRGYLMQAVGSFTHGIAEALGLGREWGVRIALGAALLVSSAAFAVLHGSQNFPLFFDRFAFGMMAGAVVILTGGLEAGIALHVLHNLFAFGLALFFGDIDGLLEVVELSWWQIPVTVVENGVYLLLVLWLARVMGVRRRTTPPPPEAARTTPSPGGAGAR